MKYKILIMIGVVIFLLGVGGSLFVLFSGSTNTVNIFSDGELIESVDLKASPDREMIVEYEGRTNTVEIKDGKIRVIDADCPDHTCIRMGYLENAAMPIVCLPNRLVITFADDASGVDAVTR
ncbi:MAG: NusG domain II-containing protein [Ruminococcus sp.]|nr:NusG domain II-containing protein [Ruminococcus sp.]